MGLYRSVICMALFATSVAAFARPWFPVETVQDGRTASYVPLAQAEKGWRVCALLPHGRDKYWWGVAWGLQTEAQRMGVTLGIYQAGGYDFLPVQRKQFQQCMALKPDAIILAAIAADGLDDLVADAAKLAIPVIDLVNGVASDKVAARSLVSFADMSAAAVQYLHERSDTRSRRLGWFPGPKGAGWVIDAEKGLARAMHGKGMTLVHGGYGPPASSQQMSLVRPMLQDAAPDFIIGNAVAVEVAANYIKYNQAGTRLVAFYATEPVIDLIRSGQVLAAASDSPVIQARIAIDLAVRVLEKRPYARRVGPEISMIDAKSLRNYDLERLFAPAKVPFPQMPLQPK